MLNLVATNFAERYIVEQGFNTDSVTSQTDDSNNSPPQKRAKRHPDGNLHPLEATSSRSTKPDVNLTGAEQLDQEPTNSNDIAAKQPLKDGMFNFFLPSEEECNSTPEENLEPNSAGLKSSRTGGVWHRSLEESHSAQIKGRSFAWPLNMLTRNPRKDSRIGYFPHSRI